MVKVRVDVFPDARCTGKCRYKVQKWVFEKKTGNTLEHHLFSQVFSWKDAHQLKRDIVNSYKEM